MPSIKTKPEGFANASLEADLLAAVNAVTPPDIIPSAEVILDPQGGLAELMINLPVDIAVADLAAAETAILNNPNVVTAVSFPIGGVLEDLDSLTPGNVEAATNTTELIDIGGTKCLLRPNVTSEIIAAASVDSVGGTGSAYQINDVDISTSRIRQELFAGMFQTEKTDNRIATIGAFKLKYDVRIKDEAAILGDVLVETTLATAIGGGGGRMNLIHNPQGRGNDKWWIKAEPFAKPIVFLDTGIDRYSFISVEIGVDLAGDFTMKAGAVSLTTSIGFVPTTFNYSVQCLMIDQFAVSTAGRQNSIIFDNITNTIISGTL